MSTPDAKLEIEINHILPGLCTADDREAIWKLLELIDSEFIPALSARESTTAKDLKKVQTWSAPLAYFDTMLEGHILLARCAGKPVGLLAFRADVNSEQLQQWSPSTYVTTTGVSLRFRRQGVGRALNDYFEDLPEVNASPWITRRTWSTNTPNIALLKSRGFEEVLRLPDHRGAGVDTIYFARRTRPE